MSALLPSRTPLGQTQTQSISARAPESDSKKRPQTRSDSLELASADDATRLRLKRQKVDSTTGGVNTPNPNTDLHLTIQANATNSASDDDGKGLGGGAGTRMRLSSGSFSLYDAYFFWDALGKNGRYAALLAAIQEYRTDKASTAHGQIFLNLPEPSSSSSSGAGASSGCLKSTDAAFKNRVTKRLLAVQISNLTTRPKPPILLPRLDPNPTIAGFLSLPAPPFWITSAKGEIRIGMDPVWVGALKPGGKERAIYLGYLEFTVRYRSILERDRLNLRRFKKVPRPTRKTRFVFWAVRDEEADAPLGMRVLPGGVQGPLGREECSFW